MEAIIRKDWKDESHLIALVWEDDENMDYLIPGIPSYFRSVWNAEGPAREALAKKHEEIMTKLLWNTESQKKKN